MAQEKDVELWVGFGIDQRIGKKMTVAFEQNTRFNNNIGATKNVFEELSLSYKFNKYLSGTANYRFGKRNSFVNGYNTEHRYNFDLRFRKKAKPLIFVFRTRFQSKYRSIHSSEDGFIPTNYNRNKFTFRFDLDRRVEPYVGIEVYYQLNNVEGNEIDNIRYFTGINIDLPKRQEVKVFYILQQEYNVNNPVTSNVIGVSYSYSLKRLKVKEKSKGGGGNPNSTRDL